MNYACLLVTAMIPVSKQWYVMCFFGGFSVVSFTLHKDLHEDVDQLFMELKKLTNMKKLVIGLPFVLKYEFDFVY